MSPLPLCGLSTERARGVTNQTCWGKKFHKAVGNFDFRDEYRDLVMNTIISITCFVKDIFKSEGQGVYRLLHPQLLDVV